MAGVATMTAIAVCFDLRSMLPSRCQLSIRGPNIRCFRNQLFSRSEDRANAKAAANRNGVVGNRGSTTPMAPIATAARPANNQKNRIFALTPAVHHRTIGRCKSSSKAHPRAAGPILLRSFDRSQCVAGVRTFRSLKIGSGREAAGYVAYRKV